MAAGDHDRQVRIDDAQLRHQILAIAIRQAEIDDRAIEGAMGEAQLVQGVGCGRGRLALQADLGKVLQQQHLDQRFVLDDQDPAGRRAGIEHVPELGAERCIGERLGDQLHARIEAAVMDNGVASVAGREQDPEIAPGQAGLIRQLPAIHAAGQADVGEQELDLRMLRQPLQSALPVADLDHLVAELAQDPGGVGAHIGIVLDHQHGLRLASTRHLGGRGRFDLRGECMQPRQVDLDRRAQPDLAVDLDVAARLLDEAVDLGQAKPGAVADLLGREERLEGARDRLPAHADAAVGDCGHDILAGHDLGLGGGVDVIEIGVGGLDGQPPAGGHGVAGVDREIQDRDLELVGVGMDRPEPPGQHGLDRDLLADGAAQEIRHAGDQPADLDRLRLERLLPGEGEQALGQRGRALGAAHRLLGGALQDRGMLARIAQMPLHALEIAHDDREQIVEVMGDAASQMADALHLLRLTQGLLRPLPLKRFRLETGVGGDQLGGPLGDLVLEQLLALAQRDLDALALLDLILRRLVELGLVDRDRRLGRDAGHQAFGAGIEHAGVGMAEKQAAQDLAGLGDHGRCQIAAHRRLAERQALTGRALAEALVLCDIRRADHRLTLEHGSERCAHARRRHGAEIRSPGAGDGRERGGLAMGVGHGGDEHAISGAGQLGRGIGHHLDHRLELELGGDRGAHDIELFERCRFLAQHLGAGAPDPGQAQIDLDPGQQLPRRERLGQIIVGAGAQALDLGLLAGARREEEDRDLAQRRIGTQCGQQAEAVQLRHHHVGQHQIRLQRPCRRQGGDAIRAGLDPVASRPQQPFDIVAHVGVVVRQQHQLIVAGAGADRPQIRAGGEQGELAVRLAVAKPAQRLVQIGLRPHAVPGFVPALADLRRRQMGGAQRNADREGAAMAQPAVDLDAAAMQPDQLLHQRQADAAALEGAAARALDPAEALEQMGQLLGRHAGAGIAHHQFGGPAVARDRHPNRDLALEGELEGVREQIEDHLLPHVAVDMDRRRQGRTIDHQPQAGLIDRRAEVRGELGGHGRQIGRLIVRLHAARLDPREIEQRVDQLEQAHGIAMRNVEQGAAVRRDLRRRLGQHLLQGGQHQGQRRAELVADIGEEGGLGAVDLGQRFGALALLLIGLGIADPGRDLAGQEGQEGAVALVEQAKGIEPDHQSAGPPGLAARGQRQDGCLAGRLLPGANRQIRPEAGREVGHQPRLLLAQHLGDRPGGCCAG